MNLLALPLLTTLPVYAGEVPNAKPLTKILPWNSSLPSCPSSPSSQAPRLDPSLHCWNVSSPLPLLGPHQGPHVWLPGSSFTTQRNIISSKPGSGSLFALTILFSEAFCSMKFKFSVYLPPKPEAHGWGLWIPYGSPYFQAFSN